MPGALASRDDLAPSYLVRARGLIIERLVPLPASALSREAATSRRNLPLARTAF